MAYGIIHHFPGGTKEQYEAVLAAVHPSADTFPDGQIFHAAGPTEDGWLVTAVHDSKESWERFRDTILMPKLRAGVEGGFQTPPKERAFEVHRLVHDSSGGPMEFVELASKLCWQSLLPLDSRDPLDSPRRHLLGNVLIGPQ